jgi:hypothetical protein
VQSNQFPRALDLARRFRAADCRWRSEASTSRLHLHAEGMP